MSNVAVFAAPDRPAYTFHEGRTITWGPWTLSAHVTCFGPSECDQCGSTDTPQITHGRQLPLPGETFTIPAPRRSGHVAGGAYRETQEPAWEVDRLCAVRCPGCGHVDVLDIERDYEPVDTEQPTLF